MFTIAHLLRGGGVAPPNARPAACQLRESGHPTRYGKRMIKLPADLRHERGRCPVAASERDCCKMGEWACSNTEGVAAARPEEVFRFRRISNHITRVPIC